MTWDRSIRQERDLALAAATAGTFLVALAIFASLSQRQWGCPRLRAPRAWRFGVRRGSANGAGRSLFFDALAFAIFAIQRNDNLAFWQLAGSWSDVFRFDAIGAAIAYTVYLVGHLVSS